MHGRHECFVIIALTYRASGCQILIKQYWRSGCATAPRPPFIRARRRKKSLCTIWSFSNVFDWRFFRTCSWSWASTIVLHLISKNKPSIPMFSANSSRPDPPTLCFFYNFYHFCHTITAISALQTPNYFFSLFVYPKFCFLVFCTIISRHPCAVSRCSGMRKM